MHEKAPAPYVNIHVNDGDVLHVGDIEMKVMHTPGHTPDSIALYLPQFGQLFSGDTLMIGGVSSTFLWCIFLLIVAIVRNRAYRLCWRRSRAVV